MRHIGGRSTLAIGLTAALALAATARPGHAAQSADEAFHDYFRQLCNSPGIVFGSPLFQSCDAAFGQPPLDGGLFVPGAAVSNLSVSGGHGTSATASAVQQRKELKARLRSVAKGKGGGASFDFSRDRLGGFVAVNYGNGGRDRTDAEQGYASDLVGILAGLDYRFSDTLLAGVSVGLATDDVRYEQNAGGLDTENKSFTLYTAYTPREHLYLGGYLGFSDLDFDATRNVAFGGLTGSAASSAGGDQLFMGAAVARDWPMGNWTASAYANLDYVATDIDAYSESGSTGLELVYSGQATRSLTSTVGLRASGKWGTVSPEVRVGWVHEFKNDVRRIDTRLVLAPTSVFTFTTDEPDRDYLVTGIGATIEAPRGLLVFVDYERMDRNSLLHYWTITAGVLGEF